MLDDCLAFFEVFRSERVSQACVVLVSVSVALGANFNPPIYRFNVVLLCVKRFYPFCHGLDVPLFCRWARKSFVRQTCDVEELL